MRRKVRSDAVLLNLPEDRQEQIIEWCDTPKSEGCVGGYEFARQQLAADGLKVSTRAVSDFYSSWHLRRDLQLAAQVEETVKAARPGEAKLAREAGEAMLLKLSLAKQDAKLFTAAACSIDSRERLDLDERSAKTKAEIAQAKLTQKDRDWQLAREKFVTDSCEKILKAARDPKMREIVEAEIPNAEKIALIRAAYFADIDATEVKLPPA